MGKCQCWNPAWGLEVMLVGVFGGSPLVWGWPFCSRHCSVTVVLLWHDPEVKDELWQDLQKSVVRNSLLKNLILNKKNWWRVRNDPEGQSLAKGFIAGSVAELAIRAGQRSQSFFLSECSPWRQKVKLQDLSRSIMQAKQPDSLPPQCSVVSRLLERYPNFN